MVAQQTLVLWAGGTMFVCYKNRHFTVRGSFTKDALQTFRQRCTPSVVEVYGREPRLGEAVSSFSASYPLPLCRRMALGSVAAHSERDTGPQAGECSTTKATGIDQAWRSWHEDPDWVEDICESQTFRELFRYKFQQKGHINCLECRVYKSWLKHCAKAHPRSRLVGLLDSRVTMGAAAKGRSSPRALSRILKSSLGYILGGDSTLVHSIAARLGTEQMVHPEMVQSLGQPRTSLAGSPR